LSIWEFSGQDSYYQLYDHFIGNTNCIHVILYNLEDNLQTQIQQCCFWLAFLQSRIPPVEPLGDQGKSHKPAYVILVGTHADSSNCRKISTGEFVSSQSAMLREKVGAKFEVVFSIHNQVLLVDGHAASSPALKALKTLVQDRKQQVIEGLPRVTQFLEQVLANLPEWKRSLNPFPAVTWEGFIQFIHDNVNPLAGDEHLKEVIQQLQLMGEVVYLKCEGEDLILLDPKWLCSTLCGYLLSQEFMETARVTGSYSLEDFQLALPEYHSKDILKVLEALGICIQCETESDTEYEFPCYNLLDRLDGLWDGEDARYMGGQYSGVVLKTGPHAEHLLSVMFPRIQIQLRRNMLHRYTGEPDLYQWLQGSKFCCGPLEGLVTLHQTQLGEEVEVKVRAPKDAKKECFFFLEEILGIIDQVLLEMSPGLPVDKYILSSEDLSSHKEAPHRWSPRDTMDLLHRDGWDGMLQGNNQHKDVSLNHLLCFKSEEVRNQLVRGCDLHVTSISTVTRQALCQLLDPVDPLGKDWCLLAVQMGLQDKVPKLDVASGSYSQTARLLDEWGNNTTSTVGALVDALRTLGREDAADVVLAGVSLYRIMQSENTEEHSTPASSGSTISR